MFSVKRKEEATELTICGIKIKLTRGIRVEHENGGPYGLCDIIKRYLCISYLVKSISVQHGWNVDDYAFVSELGNAKKLMLCWNTRYKKDWDKNSSIPCEVIGAPFVHYRRMNNIQRSETAKGTVSFVAHSIAIYRAAFNLDKYCEELKALPSKFQPVTICLHFADIEMYHLDEEYHKRGFKTVCAKTNTKPFYAAFYDILKEHKYATSNDLGSAPFYAVEMGIPFFILGDMAEFDNTAGIDKDTPNKKYATTDFTRGRVMHDLFYEQPKDVITQQQLDFVLTELGMNDCASPEYLKNKALDIVKREYFHPNPFRFALSVLEKMLRHPGDIPRIISFYKFVLANVK